MEVMEVRVIASLVRCTVSLVRTVATRPRSPSCRAEISPCIAATVTRSRAPIVAHAGSPARESRLRLHREEIISPPCLEPIGQRFQGREDFYFFFLVRSMLYLAMKM